MVPQKDNPDLTDPALLEKQLRIYATELHDLYMEEKKQREELAEDKLVLEYKLKELSALNTMFQQHLERRISVEEAFQGMISRLRALLPRASEPDLRHELQRLVDEAEATLGQPQEPPADRPQEPPQPPSGTSS